MPNRLENTRIAHRNGVWSLVRPDGLAVWSSEAGFGAAKDVRFGDDGFPDAPGPARDAAILGAVTGGHARYAFANVVSQTPDGHTATFRIFGDALQIPLETSATGLVRVSVSAALQQTLADLLDCSLLTAKLADLLFAQRTVTLAPHTQTPDATMVTSRVMVAQSAAIDAQLAATGGDTTVAQTVGKHWIVDNLFLSKAAGVAHDGRPRAINYGWHMASPKFQGQAWPSSVTIPGIFTIQNRGWAHSSGEADYSQNCVLVSNNCLVDGQPMRLEDVLRDPELAPLANHDGVLHVLRQPGVTPTAPLPRQQTVMSGELAYHLPRRTPDRLYRLVFGDRPEFGDDSDTDDLVSAAESVDTTGTVSDLADQAQGAINVAAPTFTAILNTASQIAPIAATAASIVGRATGNQTLGDLGKALGATGATAKALQHPSISGPDKQLLTQTTASIGQTNTKTSSDIAAAVDAAIKQQGGEIKDVENAVRLAILVASAMVATGIISASAAGGPYGVIVGAVIAAVTFVTSFFTGGPHLQITNGRSYSSEDYAKINLKNATDWIGNPANVHLLFGLTPKCFADTFDLFLANPHWLYINQQQTGLKQPTPPDFGTGAPLDVIYQQAPGGFELLNKVQLVLATALVHTSPGQLPFFMQVTHMKGAVKNTVDQDPSHYMAIPLGSFTTTTKPWGVIHQNERPATIKWAPGSQGGGVGSRTMTDDHGQTYTFTPDPSGFVYTGCPNLLTNDCIITPSGKGFVDAGAQIVGQTAVADGAYMLQVMLPSLTTDQCNQLFTAMKPAYSVLIAKVDAWLDTQKTAPSRAAFAQFNLTDADVTAAIALWQTRQAAKAAAAAAAAKAAAAKVSAQQKAAADAKARAAAAVAAAQAAAAAKANAASRLALAQKPKLSLPQKVLLGGGGLAALAFAFIHIRPHRPPENF